MDTQLAELIEKLKREGVEEGRLASQKIVQEASAEAVRIVEKAKQEAAGMLEDAREKSLIFQKSGELAVRQAARDAVLRLKGEIHALFDRVFKREISGTLTPETMRDMVMKMTDQWARNTGIEITLNEKEKERLESLLFHGVRKEMRNTVTLRGSRGIEHGFHIGLKGESVRYDFTDEGITQALLQFLKPRLKEIVEKGNG